MHNLSLGLRVPRDPRDHQEGMELLGGTASPVTPVKMENQATPGLRASQGRQEMWAPRARRETPALEREALQDPKGLRGPQDPPSDRTN